MKKKVAIYTGIVVIVIFAVIYLYTYAEGNEQIQVFEQNIENRDNIEDIDKNKIEQNDVEDKKQEELFQIDIEAENERLRQEEEYKKEVARVNELVKPSIVYATILRDTSVFKSGDVAEVIRDKGNGKSYLLKKDDNTYWVSKQNVSIPPDPVTKQERMTNEDVELYVNSKDFESKTSYFIWIDLERQVLHVFLGEKGNWNLQKTFQCATGRNKTPTVRGEFDVYATGKKAFIKGTCWVKNYLRFYDVYMIHSSPVNERDRITDYTLGRRVSNGCIRTSMYDSEWIQYYVTVGSKVWIN